MQTAARAILPQSADQFVSAASKGPWPGFRLNDRIDPAAEAFLRGYVEGLHGVRTQKETTIKIIAKYTRQRDPEILNKFYDEMAADLPRVPYIDEASARGTIDAMQAQGPPLPKVDVKGIVDNSLLRSMESSGLIDKLAPR